MEREGERDLERGRFNDKNEHRTSPPARRAYASERTSNIELSTSNVERGRDELEEMNV